MHVTQGWQPALLPHAGKPEEPQQCFAYNTSQLAEQVNQASASSGGLRTPQLHTATSHKLKPTVGLSLSVTLARMHTCHVVCNVLAPPQLHNLCLPCAACAHSTPSQQAPSMHGLRVQLMRRFRAASILQACPHSLTLELPLFASPSS